VNKETGRDPTLSGEETIALAYRAMFDTPSQETFRLGQLKKTNNPVHTAPIFNRVLTHLDVEHKLQWAKGRAGVIIGNKAAEQYLHQITAIEDLRNFLATVSLFLKTTKIKGRDPMQTFEDKMNKRLPPDQVVKEAYELARQFRWKQGEYNLNKFTKLTGRIHGARGKWECLAILAQYYPLRGMDQALINQMVRKLGDLDVGSFRAVVNQLLMFYSAADVKEK
jgi:hypothetical protein